MIYKRGSRYVVEFESCGKRYKISTKQGDKAAAQRLEGVFRTQVAEGKPVQLPGEAVKRRSVKDLIDATERDYKIDDLLDRSRKSLLGRARKDFGHFDVDKLTVENIDAYVVKRQEQGAANASINRVTQVVGHAYRFAGMKPPRIRRLPERKRTGFFSVAEFERLVVHLPSDLQDFCRFAFQTGMRKGEIASLRWADVEDGTIINLRGEDAKTGEPRMIVCDDALKHLIARRRNAATVRTGKVVGIAASEFIFHRDNGDPVGDFRLAWYTACKRAGLAGKLFHDFRRSAVRNMIRAGISQTVAMKVSGHKTASMFSRYNITSESDIGEAMARVSAYNAAQAGR